jgi:alginate O-acetyltransferase complex protein AlgI
MVFSTPLFLFFYLIFLLLLYYVSPVRVRNLVLLVGSLFFYYWGEQSYTVIMLLSIGIDYIHGLIVDRCKRRGNDLGARVAVSSSILFNLAILFFFKYWDFVARSLQTMDVGFLPVLNISLPIGISFYTFQTMSYTIDVYRGDSKVQKNILHFGTFVALFPQLIAGPIIKYKDMDEQLEYRNHSVEKFSSGVCRFFVGLAKKLLLANNLGQLWDVYKNMPLEDLTFIGAWMGILAFSFQIYFDFSGYSDMAIGLGRMFGFEFMENFQYPYISKSVTEFWRRWHISLSTWFREYLYIPLGGNRCSQGRWMFNLLIVWAATGIWHGASWNYLLWGLYFFFLLLLEKLFLGRWIKKLPGILQHLYLIVLVLFSWTIFVLEDLSQLRAYLSVMTGVYRAPLLDDQTLYYLRSFLPIFLVAIIGSTPFVVGLWKKMNSLLVKVVVIICGMILCTAYVVASTYNPFLYFRF